MDDGSHRPLTTTYDSCPLSILPPRDPNAPSPLTMLRDRVLALFRLDTLLADDAWNAGLIANPCV